MHTNDLILCMAACFVFGAGAVGISISTGFGALFALGALLLIASVFSSHSRE